MNDFIFFALLALALPMASIWPLRLAFRLDLNVEMFLAVLKKLVLAGSLDRAFRLARVAPQSPIARAAISLLEARKNGVADTSMLREIAAADLGELGGYLRRLAWTMPVSLLLLLAAFAVRFSQSSAVDVFSLAALGAWLLLLALGLAKYFGVRRKTGAIVDGLAELFASLDAKKEQ